MYNYEEEKKELFTESGIKTLIKIRDNIKDLINTAGAFTMDKAFNRVTGDSFTMIAAVEYLVEEGEIVEVKRENGCWTQYRVFTDPRTSNR